MSQGFGHPLQWDHHLPGMNNLLAPTPPTTRAGTTSPLLPPPSKDPCAPHHVGSTSLAQYRSPKAGDRIPQGSRQDHLYARSPVAPPLSHQAQKHGQITHEATPRPPGSYPMYSYSHGPTEGQGPRSTHTMYAPFGSNPNFAVDRNSRLQPAHPPHDHELPASICSTLPVDQPSLSKQTTGTVPESPWGSTKAGKPRKRLEQACVSCRKKKTKCEPTSSSSKCLPCDKSGSECHFDNAPRTRRYAPAAYASSPISPAPGPAPPMLEQQDSSHSSRVDQRSTANTSISSSRSSMDIGNLLSSSSPAKPIRQDGPNGSPPHKRPRHGMALPSITPRETSNALQHEAPGLSPEPIQHDPPAVDNLSWDLDPFEAMPDVTEHYLEHYFTHINTTSYCMFPRDKFLAWVRMDREKTQAEKMLLYAMLAHGSLFSNKTAEVRNSDRRFFEKIARGVVGSSVGRFSLPMVQTRLILALLNYALGNGFRAWDYCGMAVRAACGMKLNVEKGLHNITEDEHTDFGFDKATLIECRRRTFWSAYIMDRYNGFCSGHMAMVQSGNCLLRLPCDEGAYGRGEIPKTPFFHTENIDPKLSLEADRSGLGMMAYLVEVATIWGDVLGQAYRSQYQPIEAYGEPAERYYQEQVTKLETWKTGLAAHLHPSQDNIDKAFQGGYIGVFVSLWLMYHCATMKLCRHVRFQYMAPEGIERNLTKARHHARQILDMMPSLAKANREKRMPETAFIVSTPFTGYGILMAVDILTAAGSLAELPALLELLSSGTEVMEELAQYWSSASRQWDMIAERFQNLLSAVTAEGVTTGKTAFYAKKPMEVVFGLEHDLIYDVPLIQGMGMIGLKNLSYGGEELIEIEMQKQDAVSYANWDGALEVSTTE